MIPARVLGWIGAAAMAVAPFHIDTSDGKRLAIAGLLLLTLQAGHHRLWNLVIANTVSIVGFTYALAY